MTSPVVCFPMPQFEVGGLERVQMEVASGLIGAGFQVELVTRRVSNQAKFLFREGVIITVLGGGKLEFLYRLLRWVSGKDIDIIVASANDIGVFLLLFRNLFFPRSKIIWTQHSSFSGPLEKSGPFRRLRLLAEIYMVRATIRKSDSIVAVSHAVANDMRKILGRDLDVRVIYNPVVAQDFENKINQTIEWPWKNCPYPTVIFVGRLAKVKRLDLLIRAFAILKKFIPANLLIIGDGPEAGGVVRLAESLSLGESCKFIGHQDNPLPWIRQSDLLVLCSDAEGFGLVLIEAMACGIQVLSTNCPDGPAELLANGKYGRLVPTGDVGVLASAIEESLKNPVASEIMLKARAAEFGAMGAVMQYVNLFRDIQGK